MSKCLYENGFRTSSNMSQKHFIDNENTSQLIEDALESLKLQNGALHVDKKNKSKDGSLNNSYPKLESGSFTCTAANGVLL